MENKDLKIEIEVLKKRIEKLESIENKRKMFSLIKTFIIIIVLVFVGLELYKYYQKIVVVFDYLNNLF